MKLKTKRLLNYEIFYIKKNHDKNSLKYILKI